MKTMNNSMSGGLMMLSALVLLLSVPMVLGHFTLKHEPVTIVQASAENAQ